MPENQAVIPSSEKTSIIKPLKHFLFFQWKLIAELDGDFFAVSLRAFLLPAFSPWPPVHTKRDFSVLLILPTTTKKRFIFSRIEKFPWRLGFWVIECNGLWSWNDFQNGKNSSRSFFIAQSRKRSLKDFSILKLVFCLDTQWNEDNGKHKMLNIIEIWKISDAKKVELKIVRFSEAEI